MTAHNDDTLRDADLLAYQDGELDPERAARIAREPELAARAQALLQEEAVLHAALYRFTCPDTLILSEYAAGMLVNGDQVAVRRHLSACPHCTQEVSQIKSYLQAVRPDLETSLIKRARVLVARLISAAGGGLSGNLAPAFALRGETAGPLMYSADGVQLSLEVQDDPHRPGEKRVLGLVIGPALTGWQAQLWQEGRRLDTVAVDELGNFTLAIPATGTYELMVGGDDLTVHIPELTVS